MNDRKPPAHTPALLGRTATLATSGLVLAVCALMVLTPVSASVTNAVVIGAPFNHMGASIQISNSRTGCGTFSVQKNPTWSKHAGVYKVAASANASGCASPGLGTAAQWYSYLDLDQAVSISSNRAYTVNESWLVSASGAWAITPYTACKLNYAASVSECLATGGVEIYTYTIFQDEVNYSSTFSFVTLLTDFATVQNYSSCTGAHCVPSGSNYTSGNLSGTFSTSFYGYNNFTTGVLNATHTYELEIVFLAEAFGQTELENAKGKGPASAVTSFNMGKLGHSARLGPIRIS